MSEWNVNGNRPKNPDFKGELTERQQELVDLWEAQDRLKPFLSEACKNCLWSEVGVINPAAYKVVKGEATKEEAILTVVSSTRDCDGPQVNERYYDGDTICPRRESKRQNSRTNCF